MCSSISEKALKGRALDAQVGFGEAVPIERCSRGRTAFEDPERRPFAVFDFRYRTMDGLQKECIVSRPQDGADALSVTEARVSPFPEVDAFSLAEADARQMLQRYIDAERASHVKSELPRGIKRERSSTMDTDAMFLARYKGRKLRNGALEIDLTDD